MPEFEITSATSADALIELLRTHDSVILKWGKHRLTAKLNDPRRCAGSSAFTEFKWGRDKALERYISRGDYRYPWLIRIQRSAADYDWSWTGGETFVLQGSGGNSVVNCYVVGADETC